MCCRVNMTGICSPRSARAGAGALILALMAGPAPAQDGPNVEGTGTGQRGGVAQILLAADLFALGLAQQDALTVLAAARLAGRVDVAEVARDRVTTGGEAAAPAAGGPATAAQMLAAAQALAGEDPLMLDLLAEVGAEVARDRVGGAVRSLAALPPGATDAWTLPFYGQSLAEVAILGNGGGNLDLRVTDEGGQVLCQDLGPADRAYCDFVPARTGYFIITVDNRGPGHNAYHLLTN